MPSFSIRHIPLICPLFLVALLFPFAQVSLAQTPLPNQSASDLEKRVHDLEDTVRRLKEDQSSADGTNSSHSDGHLKQASSNQKNDTVNGPTSTSSPIENST